MLQQYFSHIAPWKQGITNLWNRSGETVNRTSVLLLRKQSLTTTLLMLRHKGQGHKVNDLGVILEGIISWVCMPNIMKSRSLKVKTLKRIFTLTTDKQTDRAKKIKVCLWKTMPTAATKSKNLFLASRSKTRSQGHWPWCHLKARH